MNDFECHITLEPPTDEVERAHLEELAIQHGFKTSKIDGDPVMGDKVYFYMTGHDTDQNVLRLRMETLCRFIVETSRFRPLRKKIEQIVWDERL